MTSLITRIGTSHKGDEVVESWRLPDGTMYYLLVRTRRGAGWRQDPLVFARLCDGAYDTIETWEGRFSVAAVNGWLARWGIRI